MHYLSGKQKSKKFLFSNHFTFTKCDSNNIPGEKLCKIEIAKNIIYNCLHEKNNMLVIYIVKCVHINICSSLFCIRIYRTKNLS